VADEYPGVHHEGIARTPKPVAELHILENGEEVLGKSLHRPKQVGTDRHRMGGDVVGLRRLRLVIVDKHRLKDAEKTVVVWDRCVGAPDERIGCEVAASATLWRVSSDIMQSASMKKRTSPLLLSAPCSSPPRHPDEPAAPRGYRKLPYDAEDSSVEASSTTMTSKTGIPRRQSRLKAHSDRRGMVVIGNDDRDIRLHALL